MWGHSPALSAVSPVLILARFDLYSNGVGDEVVLDPRLADGAEAALEHEIRAAGCTLPVSRSTLYRMPQPRKGARHTKGGLNSSLCALGLCERRSFCLQARRNLLPKISRPQPLTIACRSPDKSVLFLVPDRQNSPKNVVATLHIGCRQCGPIRSSVSRRHLPAGSRLASMIRDSHEESRPHHC
jgi:hypothetical protein